jgi:hypothetical protein
MASTNILGLTFLFLLFISTLCFASNDRYINPADNRDFTTNQDTNDINAYNQNYLIAQDDRYTNPNDPRDVLTKQTIEWANITGIPDYFIGGGNGSIQYNNNGVIGGFGQWSEDLHQFSFFTNIGDFPDVFIVNGDAGNATISTVSDLLTIKSTTTFDKNVYADYFIGDGSLLTGISSGTDTNWQTDFNAFDANMGATYLKLDQTVQQTVMNGSPIFDSGILWLQNGLLHIGTINPTVYENTFISDPNQFAINAPEISLEGLGLTNEGLLFSSETANEVGVSSITGVTDLKFVGMKGTFDTSTILTIGDPENPVATQNNGAYNLYDEGYYFAFNVYAYKTVGANTVYSATPLYLDFSDGGTSSVNYRINMSWDAVAGATGYRVLVMTDDYNGYYEDYYQDTLTNQMYYDGTAGLYGTYPTPTSPATFYSDALDVLGDINITGNSDMTGNLTISNLTASQALMTDANKKLISADYLNQAVKTTSSPTFVKGTVTGSLQIPDSSSATVGVIRQNGKVLLNTKGTNNIFLGSSDIAPGNFTLSGTGNIAIGRAALYQVSSGTGNFALGVNTLLLTTTGSNNVAIGTNAGMYIAAGTSDNMAIGYEALKSAKSSWNTAVGAGALIAHGQIVTYGGNTGVGRAAGVALTSGQYNTFIGTNAANLGLDQNATVTESIAIGYQATTQKSYQAVLGSTAITETLLRGNVGIGRTPTAKLDVNGIINSNASIKTDTNFWAKGFQGIDKNMTIMKTALTTCDLNFVGGLLVATNC